MGLFHKDLFGPAMLVGFEPARDAEGGIRNWTSSTHHSWPAAAVAIMTAKLRRFLDIVAPQAQCLAKALGVPWARIDFFVPPPGCNWPVVFNELEFWSTLDWTPLTDAELSKAVQYG